MIEAIIVEDKKRNANFLRSLVEEYCPEIKLVGEANTVKSSHELIEQIKPALVFLDIEMPDGTAFDLLEMLPARNFNIIFTTAYDHYAIKAIRFSALDYLLKPINYKELQDAVERLKLKATSISDVENIKILIKNLSSSNDKALGKIAFPTADGHIFINVNEIIRLEASDNYTYVFLTNKNKILASRTLKEFEVFLEKYDFARIHHSHLININHIKKYVKGKGGYVIMDDDSNVEVSSRKKEEFLRRMSIR